jgi:predicted lysophospholipase L1 biosynthesis ABC-type transport system permease subunit
LTVVFCVLFGALTFGSNLTRLVDKPAEYGDNFDLAIGSGATSIGAKIQDDLAASADVDALTLYGTTTVAVGARSLDIVGMDRIRGDLAPETLAGRLPQSNDEIALGSLAARHLGVHSGDRLAVNGASGSRTLRVTGLALVPPVGGADSLGKSGLVTKGGYLGIDPSATMNTAAVKIARDAAPGAAKRIATLTGSSAGHADPPPVILNLRRVRSIPVLVASAVGVLAMLSLGHLMITAVRRRRRDLAILRALGATPRWLTGVVHWQATILTATVLAVALPTGSALGRLLYRAFVQHVGARTDVGVPIAWLGITLLALLILANVVAAVPARRTSRNAAALTLTLALT